MTEKRKKILDNFVTLSINFGTITADKVKQYKEGLDNNTKLTDKDVDQIEKGIRLNKIEILEDLSLYYQPIKPLRLTRMLLSFDEEDYQWFEIYIEDYEIDNQLLDLFESLHRKVGKHTGNYEIKNVKGYRTFEITISFSQIDKYIYEIDEIVDRANKLRDFAVEKWYHTQKQQMDNAIKRYKNYLNIIQEMESELVLIKDDIQVLKTHGEYTEPF